MTIPSFPRFRRMTFAQALVQLRRHKGVSQQGKQRMVGEVLGSPLAQVAR